MTQIVVVGIDPGLVDTGVVRMVFDFTKKTYAYDYKVFTGLAEDVSSLADWCIRNPGYTFIEAYRPRSAFKTDARMGTLVNDIRRAIPGAKTLLNQGVLKVIKRPLMEALHVWDFDLKTHHQDLRSAARIGLYGMVKDVELNAIVYEYVKDFVEDNPWQLMKGITNG